MKGVENQGELLKSRHGSWIVPFLEVDFIHLLLLSGVLYEWGFRATEGRLWMQFPSGISWEPPERKGTGSTSIDLERDRREKG